MRDNMILQNHGTMILPGLSVIYIPYFITSFFFVFCFVLFITYGRWASMCKVTNPTYCDVAILAGVTKDLPISPRLSPSEL